MNMKLKKILDDIQKTEDKIAELQEHLKRQNTLKQQMEDMEIIKSVSYTHLLILPSINNTRNCRTMIRKMNLMWRRICGIGWK